MDSFKLWGGKDLYGFTPPGGAAETPPDDGPAKTFSTSGLIAALARAKIGGRPGKERFDSQVDWGVGAGTVRADLTPNWRMIVFRQARGRDGQARWLLKRAFKIDTDNYTGREETVADEILGHVRVIASEPIDGPADDYPDLLGLTRAVAARADRDDDGLLTLDRIHKVGDDNYLILFNVRGGGVGKLVSLHPGSMTPSMRFDLSFHRETGLIHVIFTNVKSEGESGSWEMDLPSLDCWFAPSQPREEIVRALVTWTRHY